VIGAPAAEAVNKELALVCGFLFAVCLLFGAIAWVAMNYLEDDLDGFARFIEKQGA